jgi:anti-sigma regulatory factor (Ser/Thr protein kinase)
MNASASELPQAFRHEALLYHDETSFLDGTIPFLRDGVAAGEPIFVLESIQNIGLLRTELGGDAASVRFADMAEVGANPARIIPAWREFVEQHPGRRMRGIGEPIWEGRRAAELVECQRHESLLNVAFDSDVEMWLLCPYDTNRLNPEVVAEARRSHPFIVEGSSRNQSADYRNDSPAAISLDAPLPEPPLGRSELVIEAGALTTFRTLVTAAATGAGIDQARVANVVMAANEVATNSLRHGGGKGILRVWRDDGALIVEIRDHGRFDRPLVDRERPPADAGAPRGLWLANQLCDLVQIRSDSVGTVVRLHMRCAVV